MSPVRFGSRYDDDDDEYYRKKAEKKKKRCDRTAHSHKCSPLPKVQMHRPW